jgi:hypothetical protein
VKYRHRFRVKVPLAEVADSIFPGQSTAAVALGGMRTARSVLGELGHDAEKKPTPCRMSEASKGY